MPTIDDIAKLAGVSHGTASNVLNGRGNVSSGSILKVMAAAQSLGYVPNAQAQQLRKKSNTTSYIAILCPNIHDTSFRYFYEGARSVIESAGYLPLFFVTNDSLFQEKTIVTTVAELRVSGVLTASCNTRDPDFYHMVENIGCAVVHAFRDNPAAKNFVGFDAFANGADIADYVIRNSCRSAAILTGNQAYSDNQRFLTGFQDSIERFNAQVNNAGKIRSTFFEFDSDSSEIIAADLFISHPPFDIIITTNDSLQIPLHRASAISSFSECPPLLSLTQNLSPHILPQTTAYYMDYYQLGCRAAEVMFHAIQNSAPQETVFLPANGFKKEYFRGAPSVPKKKDALRVILSRGASTDALIRLSPEFTKKSGYPVEFTVLSDPLDLYDAAVNAEFGQFDVIRNNMSNLPALPPGRFLPFEKEEFSDITAGMFPRLVKEFSYSADTLVAVPFEMGTQVLAYRRDLFEDPLLRRIFFEKCRYELTLPRDYSDFITLLEFFSSANNRYSPVTAASSINVYSKSELWVKFLVQYLNSLSSPDDAFHTNASAASFERLISDFRTIVTSSFQTRQKPWIGSPLDNLFRGIVCMELTFVNYAPDIMSTLGHAHEYQIDYTFPPGGTAYLTGGSLSVFQNSKQQEASKEFIRWACSSEQAERFALSGGISPHQHIYKDVYMLDRHPWLRLIEKQIDTCFGRSLWERVNAHQLEHQVYPILLGIAEGAIENSEGARKVLAVIDENRLIKKA